MKRIYSFLLACFTILVIMVATVPNLKDSLNLSAEFKDGYEVVYKVSNVLDDGEASESQLQRAAELMQKRIDDKKLNDSYVRYEEDNLVVNLIAEDYSEVNKMIEDYIEVNKVVTVGDSDYPERYTFAELFDEESIEWSLDYNTYSYVLTAEADKNGKTKLEKLGDDFTITIWDDYYGEDKDEEGNFTTISDLSYSKGKLKISYTDPQKMIDETFVMAFGDLGVNIEQTSIVKVPAKYGDYALLKYFISLAAIIVLVSVIFVRFYKKAGILGSILTLFATGFTLIGFYWLNGTYSLLSCLGIIISVGLSADLFVGITQKVRASLYKGRNVSKAFNEGYLKSLPLVIDSLLIVIGASIVLYYAGKGDLKSLALMSFAGGISNALFIGFGYFLSGYFLLGGNYFQDKNFFNIDKDMIVSLNSEVIKSNEDRVYGNKFKQWYKLFLPVMLIVVVVAIALGTTLKLTDNQAANFQNGYANNYVLRVNVENAAFASKNEALKVFDDIKLKYDSVNYGTSTVYDEDDNLVSSYVITFYGEDDSLVENKEAVVAAIKEIVGEDYEDSMVYSSSYSYPFVEKNTTKVLTASCFVLLFLTVYFLIRYRLRMTISTLAGSLFAALAYASVAVITRLPIDLFSFELLPLVLVFSYLFSSYTFDKAKTVLKDSKEVSKEELIENISGSVNYRLVFSLYVYSLVILVLVAMSNSLTVLSNVLGLIVALVAILTSMFVTFKIWINFYLKTNHDKKKKERKFKRFKIKPLNGEPQEYTFTGIND